MYVQAYEHAVVLVQFSTLPPVQDIGKATLIMSKQPGLWPCRKQVTMHPAWSRRDRGVIMEHDASGCTRRRPQDKFVRC
jgi:hypothetical protein